MRSRGTVLLKTLIMNGRCKSKSAANSKNQLFASIFDFADAFRITFEAALCPVNAYNFKAKQSETGVKDVRP
jgi:hypothetical protein